MIYLIWGVALILVVVFNFMLFQCVQTVFLQRLSWKRKYLYTTLINVSLFVVCCVFEFYVSISMLLFFVAIIIEIRLLYKEHWRKSVFCTFCFAMIFFALWLLYVSIYSMVRAVPISYSLLDEKAILLVGIFTVLTLILCIIVFSRYFSCHITNMIFSDKLVLVFANMVFGLLYIYLMIQTFTLYSNTTGQLMQWLYVTISIFLLIGFGATITYMYFYSNGMLFKKRSDEIEIILEESQRVCDEMQYVANHDSLTTCYTKNFAFEALEKAIHTNNKFCVIYFDIDGLQLTNDTFEHNEGDWYIQQVANILQNVFKSHPVCRMESDEFLAILEKCDVYLAMRFAIRSFKAVEALSVLYKKPFTTSLSYGIISYEKKTTLSVEEIIHLANKRRCEFKNHSKKKPS